MRACLALAATPPPPRACPGERLAWALGMPACAPQACNHTVVLCSAHRLTAPTRLPPRSADKNCARCDVNQAFCQACKPVTDPAAKAFYVANNGTCTEFPLV